MKYTGFLCGGFSITEKKYDLKDLWTQERYTDEKIHECESFYLPEFVRFNLNPEAVEFGAMSRYRMAVDRTLQMAVPVTIPEMRLYVMPFNMALFAVRVEMESEDINAITTVLSKMRNLARSAELPEFFETVLKPIKDTYILLTGKAEAEYSCKQLVEDGNKFKIFQIAQLQPEVDDVKDKDVLLFELGTVAPIGSYDEKSLYSASESYYNRLLSENKLSIFNNWSCLSLTDTVTILAENSPAWLVDNWINDYFGLIYIWQLFRKNYIFRLTRNFRFEKKDPEKLIKESFEFEKKCSFNIISYNFLPEEFKRCVEHGLKIEEDKEVLYQLLEQENTSREKDSDSKMNYLLFFMTCLTMFSTIYDACGLINEMFPYELSIGSNVSGYRFFASALATVILLSVLINRMMIKKRK